VIAEGGLNHSVVMPGLVPGIHVLFSDTPKTWMAGTSPAMTREQAHVNEFVSIGIF
jgi:hypothetical protein